MIIEARKLELTTRDIAPQPGETVRRHSGGENAVLRVVSHWPVMVTARPSREPCVTQQATSRT